MGDVKLSERLRRMANCHSMAQDPYTGVFRDAAQALVDLESTNAELTARVAELDGIERHLRLLLSDLQSQLAWTPVSAGLPTEPGLYEFLYRDFHDGSLIHLYELDAEAGFCVGNTGHPIWFSLDSRCNGRYNYTHYRRIELPEAK